MYPNDHPRPLRDGTCAVDIPNPSPNPTLTLTLTLTLILTLTLTLTSVATGSEICSCPRVADGKGEPMRKRKYHAWSGLSTCGLKKQNKSQPRVVSPPRVAHAWCGLHAWRLDHAGRSFFSSTCTTRGV